MSAFLIKEQVCKISKLHLFSNSRYLSPHFEQLHWRKIAFKVNIYFSTKIKLKNGPHFLQKSTTFKQIL